MAESKFNKNLVRSIILAIAVFLVTLFIKKQLSKIETKDAPKISFRSKIVEVVPAEPSTVKLELLVSGRLQATNRMDLYAEVNGILLNNNFREGQAFGAGQRIASIDNSEYSAQLVAARSGFMGLMSQSLADIALDYPEEYPTWEAFLKKIEPKQNLPKLPTVANQQLKQFLSGRNILSNYYTIQSQEVRLNKYTISAPFSVVLCETTIDPGTLVRAGQKLGSFVQSGSFELEASVTTQDLAYLKKGSKVVLKTDDKSQEYTGTVVRINNTINPNTQLAQVYLSVRGKELKEGLYLKAEIDAGSTTNGLKIDRNMLINETEVYIVQPDSSLHLQPIEVVSYMEDQAVIKGVPQGTLLPTSAISGAFEGMKIVPQLSAAE